MKTDPTAELSSHNNQYLLFILLYQYSDSHSWRDLCSAAVDFRLYIKYIYVILYVSVMSFLPNQRATHTVTDLRPVLFWARTNLYTERICLKLYDFRTEFGRNMYCWLRENAVRLMLALTLALAYIQTSKNGSVTQRHTSRQPHLSRHTVGVTERLYTLTMLTMLTMLTSPVNRNEAAASLRQVTRM